MDCGDCSLILEIAVGLWRLQSDCGDCSLIVEIAIGLWRLQSNCRDYTLDLEKYQSLGNVLKLLAHSAHQAVRFILV